jgi:UDPglucose--hexose-1-phosphate uridylyltransferase
MNKQSIVKPDGRLLWYYWWTDPPVVAAGPRQAMRLELPGLELRWNPFDEEWVMVAPSRQERTFLPPREQCPLCPTRLRSLQTEVPSSTYEIVVFENRFPPLHRAPPQPARRLASVQPARGACEVVVYSQDHDATLADLDIEQITRLIEVWTERYLELSSRKNVKYVFVFENRGEQIGVTLSHPHGQIYAFPFVPPRVRRQLASSARHSRKHGSCLQCMTSQREEREKTRIVVKTPSIVAYVPFFARLPYEVHVTTRQHRTSLAELLPEERADLARVLQVVLRKYDNLWNSALPFTMSMLQRPADGKRYPGCHFRIEFAPVHRGPDKLKYLAGCEVGAGTFINDRSPEKTAAQLRRAAPRT